MARELGMSLSFYPTCMAKNTDRKFWLHYPRVLPGGHIFWPATDIWLFHQTIRQVASAGLFIFNGEISCYYVSPLLSSHLSLQRFYHGKNGQNNFN